MKIQYEKYNPGWKQTFEKIKSEIATLFDFATPKIEHIGSTAVQGLSAKPIIDILVGIDQENIDKIIKPLIDNEYIYHEKYNDVMPYRRFFVKLKVSPASLSLPTIIRNHDEIPPALKEHCHRLAQVHALAYNSKHWIRHIAFRDYLKTHPYIRNQYQQLKQELSTREWIDGNHYNQAKNTFVKAVEQNAVKWYNETNNRRID
jgi:GrpB-like predicted nucleotidyltransferase (UPF0157 family)